ncbi:hypothetical protein [Burkholderia sp. ISTR5]|uniref:hypothetical protein n=1 Tax=Burkholderia sp. ISTR5 TaxID=2500161 RepID=UPI00136F965F|nr:hypothetical protein [Burkholderia sp. ISTR5]NBI44941.1 hypothetical protein [Burkholderia sp. ISTR5]
MTNNTTAAALTDEQIRSLKYVIGRLEIASVAPECEHANNLRALLTSPRAAVPAPEGWKLVPIEPTQEMLDCWWGGLPKGTAFVDCTPRGVYGAMLDAAPAAPVAEPTFTDTGRAALAWVLWHHQGASSFVGQPIRYALGMGQHEELSDAQIEEAKSIARLCKFPGKQHSAAQAVAADGEPLVRNLSPLERVEEDIVVMTRMSNDTKRLPMEETESLARLLYYIEDLRRAAVSPATADERAANPIKTTERDPSFIDNDLDFEPDAQHAVADMANIGYALMQTIERMAPGYCWNESPTEIVSDLINERDEARASQAAAPADAREVVAYTSPDRLRKIAENPGHIDAMWGVDLTNEGENIPLYTGPVKVPADAGEAVAPVVAALRKLVHLKSLKDGADRCVPGYIEDRIEYQRDKPKAWDDARAALASFDAAQGAQGGKGGEA